MVSELMENLQFLMANCVKNLNKSEILFKVTPLCFVVILYLYSLFKIPFKFGAINSDEAEFHNSLEAFTVGNVKNKIRFQL